MKKKITVVLATLFVFFAGYFAGYSRSRYHWRNEALSQVMHYRVYLYGPECGYSAACKEKAHVVLAMMNGDTWKEPGSWELYVDSQ